MSELLMCDVCPGKEAVALYRWSWGESGACSQDGQFLLQQKATNLGQTIDFSPLPAREQPLQRSERAGLAGQIYALQAENTELRGQLQALYVETEKLRSDNRLMVAREHGAKAQLHLAEHRAEEAVLKLGENEVQLIDMMAENERLKMMTPRPEESLAVHARIAELEAQLAELSEAVAARDARIVELEEQMRPHVVE